MPTPLVHVGAFYDEMNGVYHFPAEQLAVPPDSSGMMNISDSEFGSSDSSSLSMGLSSHSHAHPNLLLNGGGDHRRDHQLMMMGGTTVQNQTYITQTNPVARHQNYYNSPYNYNSTGGYQSHHHNHGGHQQGSIKPMIRSPSGGGKPAAMAQACMQTMNNNESRNRSTDNFLSEFQAQMAQMKTAMDAVQNEILLNSSPPAIAIQTPHHPPHHPVGLGGGKPRAAAGMGMTSFSGSIPPAKRGPGRPRGSGTAAGIGTQSFSSSSSSAPVRYQSQISAMNGLKLKIKKSPRQLKRKGSKAKGRKKKRKGEDEDDEDDEDDELGNEKDYRRPSVQKSTKVSQQTAKNNLGDDHESATNSSPSGWGDRLPENVLSKILSYAVKSEEGCIPVLVR